ncbi:ABC transporter permease [Alkaliphilus peptidifermentans]|uniref:Putative ABC transport system permease protein n=1 Tax=Alkaliphilus peptidifermentans DSM 18978 TaxID=1120976 RepID=A0A1G5IDL2_9FIRM|nr:ABC transporter permease [Alkaliphilus peptidifermentans]SCY74094.1 putative ABC transport system permease protein [Alkaliphilus peptidifermentans DSM 18978]
MVLYEIFKVSIQNIWVNKMRSSLTMLGLIIGIMSVVIITTLGNAAQADMSGAFQEHGKGKLTVRMNYNADRPVYYRDLFSDADVESIDHIEDIVAAAPDISRWVDLKYGDKNLRMDLYGVNHNYDLVDHIDLLQGRFLTESDILGRRNVIVIDERAAQHLFGTVEAIGETVSMASGYQTIDLMIIGVTKMSDSVIANMAMGNYNYGYMPISLATRLFNLERYPRLTVQAIEAVNVDGVGEQILNLLERKNKDRDIYRINNMETEFNQLNQGLGFLTTTISGIAAISLLVGGIGIMNIMLVSVTERTREIGIRKAIGANRGTILLQFLLEAVILSFMGGLLGLLFGSGIGYSIVKLIKLPFIISVDGIIIAFIFSVVVGVIFGVYPANKASKLDPIEALRYE